MRRKYEITITTALASPKGGWGVQEEKEMGEKRTQCYWKRWKSQDVKIMEGKKEKKEKTGCK